MTVKSFNKGSVTVKDNVLCICPDDYTDGDVISEMCKVIYIEATVSDRYICKKDIRYAILACDVQFLRAPGTK